MKFEVLEKRYITDDKFLEAIDKFKNIKKRNEGWSENIAYPDLLFPSENRIKIINDAIYQEKGDMKNLNLSIHNSMQKMQEDFEKFKNK